MKFIPKVGEPCICTSDTINCKVTPKFVGNDLVIFMYLGTEACRGIDNFKPIKTPAEIESEELTSIIYGGGRLDSADLAKMIIDAGWSKQQVKPLHYEDAVNNLGIGAWQYEQLIKLNHTIQGGDK